MLDLEGHGDFVELSRVGALGRQKEVSRYLLRDGGAALTAPAREDVDERRAHDARDLNPGVLVKTVVLCREDRVLHVVRHVGKLHEVAPLLAEFADQLPVRAPDAKRHLGAVVREGVNGGKLPIDVCEDEDEKQNSGKSSGCADADNPFENAPEGGGSGGFLNLLGGAGNRHGRSPQGDEWRRKGKCP